MISEATRALQHIVRRSIREAVYYSPFRRYFFYRYCYNFAPAQLAYLCECIDRTKEIPGAVLEVGCANGHSTVFLNKHIDFLGVEKPYVALDTFSGFTDRDVDYETGQRRKRSGAFDGFRMNSVKWFKKTCQDAGIDRVRTIKADICSFAFDAQDRFSFCLLDVDLYLPTKSALEKTYPLMSHGGIIVVDDCRPNRRFDGAYQAYMEFVATHDLPVQIILQKLGVIEVSS